MLTGTQRPFGPERFEAKPSRFATPEDPVQIDAGGEVIDIVVDLEQPQGGDDVRQVGLGLFQPRPILRNGITDAVGFLRRMVIAWGSAMPTFWRHAIGLAPRAKVSLLHNAGEVGWGTRIRVPTSQTQSPQILTTKRRVVFRPIVGQ